MDYSAHPDRRTATVARGSFAAEFNQSLDAEPAADVAFERQRPGIERRICRAESEGFVF
jgi:hypothetical protein